MKTPRNDFDGRAPGTRRIRNPEELDAAIKISTPNIWAVVVLSLLALVLFFLWACFGSISVRATASAWVEGGQGVLCLGADKANGLDPSEDVLVDGAYRTIESISPVPLSSEELESELSSEALNCLDPSSGSYLVRFDASGSDDGEKTASIVVGSVQPLSFLSKGR
jgi:hypothetical protein